MCIFNRIIAILLMLLGIIHDVATFTPLITGGLESVSEMQVKALTYMSLICGASIILSGLLLFLLLTFCAEDKCIKNLILYYIYIVVRPFLFRVFLVLFVIAFLL